MHCIAIRMVVMRQQQISDFSYVSTKAAVNRGGVWFGPAHTFTWIVFPAASGVTSYYFKLLYERLTVPLKQTHALYKASHLS